jgi:hypothetical protein
MKYHQKNSFYKNKKETSGLLPTSENILIKLFLKVWSFGQGSTD